MYNLCVFAGTQEGHRLISLIQGRGAAVTACVATEYGREMLGGCLDTRVLTGRMTEAEMEALFRREVFDLVVDATHPYADQATENIAAACEATHTPYLRLQRDSERGEADGVCVPDTAACVEYLKTTEGPILLTTGSKELPLFCADEGLKARIYARVLPMMSSLKICEDAGLKSDHIIAMQGPFDEDMNLSTLRAVRASWLVTKDTGSAGGYEAKIRAAKCYGARCVIIGRPPQREGRTLEQVIDVIEKTCALSAPDREVALVGIGLGDEATRTVGMERAVREADCLIGARRMLDAVAAPGQQTFEAFKPGEIGDYIRHSKTGRRFAVLLSGDTGFYSGAKALLDELSDMAVTVLPGVSSLQALCARLGRSWENVYPMSLHGREGNLAGAVRAHEAVFVLVGGEHGARDALARLVSAGLGDLRAAVGERLGYPDERVTEGPVSQLAQADYDRLSVILVDNPGARDAYVPFGLPDESFERDETPMTKAEVRAVSMSKLRLTPGAVVYDVGSGSGSVTVEAALTAVGGRVYAVEMKPQAAELTRKNVARFGLENVTVVEGKAPDALETLPAPTHAFIGGSAGSLRRIVECLLQKNPNVRIVANAVTLESVGELSEIAKDFPDPDICQISVSRARRLGRYNLMTAQNPVYIFALQRGAAEPKEKDE